MHNILINNCAVGVLCMKRFQIPSIPSTTNNSIRFPNNLIEQVEEEIKGTNCTFSAFVVEAVRVALEETREADSK